MGRDGGSRVSRVPDSPIWQRLTGGYSFPKTLHNIHPSRDLINLICYFSCVEDQVILRPP